jgi:hypothetical protein
VALLDRGFGRPAASVELELTLNKSFNAMSLEELQDLREKYAQLTVASPLVIEHDDAPIEADDEQGDA